MNMLHHTLAALALAGAPIAAQDLALPYERFELDNGLEVIVHEDHSDPVVAVYVYYHVGSGREEPGRSGFAHLFEHMMFQGSQHVGDDQHFKIVQESGGTLNGTTNTDRTMYYEVMPSNQLETALWLEADRMGFLLPSMTQEKLDNQREVVKNERRQNYENRPYGLLYETLARTLYPAGHPYSWTTIGSMDDLSAASMEDVSSFFRRWYGPNNAILAVGGDVDPETVRKLAERYFGAIPRGPEVKRPRPQPIKLERTKRLAMEDKVQLPQLTYTWATVPRDHPDEAALNMLASVLSANKSAILDKALTVDAQLASLVSAGHDGAELAGDMTITLQPQPGVTLDQLELRMHELLNELAENGVEEERMTRLRNRYEAQTIRGLETVQRRTARIATDALFRDDPGYLPKDLARHLAVTAEDVQRVLKKHLIGEPAVVISIVPEGQLELAASGRTSEQNAAELALDRTQRPTAGELAGFVPPPVWRGTLANGVSVAGTPFTKLPLSTLSLSVPAGRLNESMDQLGLASLTADLLSEGTERLSGTDLQDAFDAIGATLRVSSSDDEITISVSALEKHLPGAVALMTEVLLAPRFADNDFERLRTKRLTGIQVRADSIRSIASDAWNALMYGVDTVAGSPGIGTEATVAGLSANDVRTFWTQHADPRGSRLVYVGARDLAGLTALLEPLTAGWTADSPRPVEASLQTPTMRFPDATTIYVVDKPGAAQSEIRVGHPGVSSLDPVAYDLTLVNYPLGGSFSSRINLNLREDKGYTYGARSSFGGGLHPAPFTASSSVRTDVTAESVVEFMKELEGILTGATDAEIAFMRDALTQSMARQFESTRALAGFLGNITRYDWPSDYPAQRLERVRSITAAELKALANEYIQPKRMAILVVGDLATIRESLDALPYPVVEL